MTPNLSFALQALVLTLVCEVPLVALVFKGQRLRMAIVAAGTTGVCNLSMNLLLLPLFNSYTRFILIGELGAVLLEAAVSAVSSKPREPSRALLASALANTASFLAGVVVFQWLGWFF